MSEIFEYDFFINAILAGILVSLCCALIGSLAMINKLLPMAGGITHGAFGGIGIAFYFSLNVFLCTSLFTIFLAFVLSFLSQKFPNRNDNFTAVIWTFGMALGLVLIDLSPSYQNDLFVYLFGSILTVSNVSLIRLLFANLFFLFIIFAFYRQFIAISFDKEFASLRGINTSFFYYLLICMMALCIVLCMQTVGLILILALLSIPCFIAEKFTKSLASMMFFSFILSMFFCIFGIFLSYFLNLSGSASIVALACLAFVISIFIKPFAKQGA